MAKSKQKLDLNTIIEDMDFKALLQLAVQNRNKRNAFSFSEYFNKQNGNDVPKTITALTKLLLICMEKYLAGNGHSDWTKVDVEDSNTVSQIIQVVVDIGLVSLQLNITSQCQVELATLLNGILPEVPSTMDSVKNSIALYCEKLFATNTFDKSEYFLFNVLLYLVQRTLGNKPIKSDVKRIYSIRKVIGTILEMKASNSKELWDLFKICVTKPVYLTIVEGQKVLGLVTALNIDKIGGIHEVIRKNLPTVNVYMAAGYGRLYFEAWCYCIKNGKHDVKNVIEITCLQDFILMAINTKNRPFMPLVRKLLGEFHCHKKETEVSKMLYCLYQPLLWRFLKNPDGQIRANATQLFLDIFPLEDPEVKVVATDLELNDQLLMIRDLLVDDFPIVRITTTLGICVSMSVNWEVFPEEMLKTYFRIIVDDLSRDSSSSEVRCAVVKGLKCLLENPLTMRCLVSILPKLQGLFHDISENVRIAFCQLLLRVKTISAIKYFHIVPIKHLFARLEEDCYVVKKSIAKLMNNSYFPRNEDPKCWMGRCLEIIRTERSAARSFFSYVGHYIGVDNSVIFMTQATRAVHFYVKTKQSSGQMELSNKENIVNYEEYIVSLEEAVGFNNLITVSTVMDCIAAMWLSQKSNIEKPENKHLLKILVGRIGKPLADLCLFYKDTEAWESVFYVSSYLPPAIVPSLGSLCFWKLKNLPPDAQPREYMTILECLCNQQQGYELLKLLQEWIEAGLTDSYVPPPAKRRKKKGKRDSPHYDQPKPYLANRMLDSMFNHRNLQKQILAHDDVLREMLNFIDEIKKKLERFGARLMTEKEASFLSLLMYNILRIAIFLHDEENIGDVVFINEVVLWMDQKLIRHLMFTLEGTDHFTWLISNICKQVCQVMADITALGFCDPNNRIYLVFFEKLLRSGMGYRYAVITSRFLYKHAASSQYLYLVENDTSMLQHLLGSICNIFDSFCDEALLESIPASDMKELQFTLGSVMQIIHNHVALLNEPASSAFKCILKNIIDSMLIETNFVVEDMSDGNFEDITFPTVGAFFMAIMNQKPLLLPIYVKFLNEFYCNSEKELPFWIACWTIAYRVLDVKSSHQPTLRECNILVTYLEKTILEIYPKKSDSEPLNSSKKVESVVPMQMFKEHCHNQFRKLKSRLYSKICAAKLKI